MLLSTIVNNHHVKKLIFQITLNDFFLDFLAETVKKIAWMLILNRQTVNLEEISFCIKLPLNNKIDR